MTFVISTRVAIPNVAMSHDIESYSDLDVFLLWQQASQGPGTPST
jgi:hypothetical protein